MPHSRWEELLRLVDAEDVQGILDIVSSDEIAQAWCDFFADELPVSASGEATETPSDFWVVEFFYSCLPTVPQLHRQLILKLVDLAPTDAVLEAIGAGPFEDWLYSSPDEIQWMEVEASKSDRFRRAFDVMRF